MSKETHETITNYASLAILAITSGVLIYVLLDQNKRSKKTNKKFEERLDYDRNMRIGNPTTKSA